MSYTVPRLTNGMSAGQSIYQTVTTPLHPVGTRAVLPDGRVFYYSINRTNAILAAGKLTKMNEVSVDFDDLATNTAAVGDMVVNVTPVGTATFSANEFAGGFLSINSGTTGAGTQYRISHHAATTAATAFDIYLSEPIRVAFDANTTATVVPNPWSDCVITDADETQFVNGAAPVAVPVGSDSAPVYFWNQTWGPATVLGNGTPAIGQAIQVSATTGGAFDALTEGAGTANQPIGTILYTSVSGDYTPVFLTIAP